MSALSPRDQLHQLIDLAKTFGATAADALWVHSTDLATSRRMGQPEGIERSESSGIGLRVLVGQRQAVVSSSDLRTEPLRKLVEEAVAMAKLAPVDPYTGLADASQLAKTWPALDLLDPEAPTPEWLLTQCAAAEDTARSTPGITNSEGAEASYSRSQIALATSGGFFGEYASSAFSLSASVLAGSGNAMERDYAFSAARHRADLQPAEAIGREAAERTLKRLNPRKIPSCQVPLLFEPRVARGLLSNFAAAINGAAVARGTSFLKDKRGSAVFAPGVTISDDPHRLRGLGSKPFDGEGIATKARNFVENGVLTEWVLDCRSAKRLGLSSTGHASRSVASLPSPSTTNLYLHAGQESPEEMIRALPRGLYVTEAFGMGVNLVTGDYSQGASGFWIENGELAYPVSEITIAGHLGEMFRALTPANDLVFRYATNAPTLRVDGMTIAGA